MALVNKTALKAMVKENGVRISQEAVDKLVEILTDIAEDVIKTAAEYAKHAGRKTIRVDDIKLAVK